MVKGVLPGVAVNWFVAGWKLNRVCMKLVFLTLSNQTSLNNEVYLGFSLIFICLVFVGENALEARPISVSFLICTSGKEYHSQAGSTT